MKKTLNFVFAAIAMLTVASCAKELAPETVKTGVEKTLTFSFDAAKTALDDAGKTVWVAGDSIWVSDGTTVDKIYVPEEFDGEATFTYTSVHFSGVDPLYAVYPCSAAKSVSKEDGVLKFNISSDQDGSFESANICVAKSSDFKFAMKNATGLLKISVVDNIETVVVSSNAVISGEVTVSDFETLALSPVTTTGTTINLTAAGLAGDYYLAVAPGTYSQFGLLALTTDGQFQKKDATTSNTIARSQIATLGEIGSDLTGLEGSGSEDDPYVIPHVGAMTAFAAMVNGGETFEGMFVKVTADFDGVTLPAGYYKSADDQASFKGNFDGQNHTIGLAVTSNSAPTQGGYLGLFGFAEAPAIIENVKVDGTVTGNSGNCVGGVVGCLKGVEASMDSCFVVNCVNDAVVSSKGSHTGGVVGWAGNYCHIIDCQNNAAVTSSTSNLGGIVGYLNFHSVATSCVNKGNITNTQNRNPSSSAYAPTGGIAGIVQKLAVVTDCVNDGDIYGNGMVGGIMGAYQARNATVTSASTLWGAYGPFGYTPASNADLINSAAANHSNNINNGTVDGQVTVGGIIGGSYYGNTVNCVNNGEVKGAKLVGGILGWTQNAASKFDVNNGKVTGTGLLVAGIMAYKYWSSVNGAVNNADVTGGQLVGGIVAGSHKQSNIDNSVNYGKVTATATPKVVDEETGDVSGLYAAGGIIGGTWAAQQQSVAMRNCLNYGDVVYVNPCPDPFVGGLYGYASSNAASSINNSVNVGVVSCAGTAVEGATAGAIGGKNNNTNTLANNCFYKVGTYAQAYGFNPVVTEEDPQGFAFNEDGDVVGEVKPVIGGATYDSLIDALNAWRNENVYYYEWSWDETNKVPVLTAPTE